MMRGRILGLLVGIVVIAGCGGDEPTGRVTIAVPDARWMAVRTVDEPAWTRVDPVHRIETSGWFEVAVVCREDVGDGWTWLATPADRPEDTDGVWESRCGAAPGGATAVFDAVGRVDEIFIGRDAAYGPEYFSVELAPGTYDVVAVRYSLDGRRAERVQMIRGVELAAGTTRIPIDVEALGAPTEDASIEVNGVRGYFHSYYGETAGGTAFRLGYGNPLVALAPSQRIAGDREVVEVSIIGGAWVRVDFGPGANTVQADLPAFEAAWPGDALAVSWTSPEPWERVGMNAFAETADGSDITFPMWSIVAWRGALEARAAAGGEATLALEAPGVPGWQASWMPEAASRHRRNATWVRSRPDGWEGYYDSDRFNQPLPPAR